MVQTISEKQIKSLLGTVKSVNMINKTIKPANIILKAQNFFSRSPSLHKTKARSFSFLACSFVIHSGMEGYQEVN